MSSQRGNNQRTRPQKYKNRKVFKNDLHDKTPLTKFLNGIHISNVCERCKFILEWKIKYKKYKPIKSAKKCTKCDEKTVKHAYHIMCSPCANKWGVCPKCGKNEEIVEKTTTLEEKLALDMEMQQTIKKLSERKRRTFLRYLTKIRSRPESEIAAETEPARETTLDDIREKLESLKVESDDNFDSDYDDDDNDGADDDADDAEDDADDDAEDDADDDADDAEDDDFEGDDDED